MASYPEELHIDAHTRIRLAHREDFNRLVEVFDDPALHGSWGGPQSQEMISQKYLGVRLPSVIVYVIILEDEIIGIVQAWQESDRCGLDLGLVGRCQGRGIGPRVASALASCLRDRGWERLSADPRVSNTHAIRAWEKAGFVRTTRTGMEHGETTLLMEFPSSTDGSTPSERRPD